METTKVRLVGCSLLFILCVGTSQDADAQQAQVSADAKRWVIEAVGTETVRPDVVHLMMKMEYESGLAADATRAGEQRLREFLTAVDALKIPNLTYRLSNTVITPAAAGRGAVSGFVYTRNIVFTLTYSEAGQQPTQLDPVIAQLEDLGARYNSHCVTCIGSG